jgi:alcohol dehydrogenase class IV
MRAPATSTINYLTSITLGAGAAEATLAGILRDLNIRRPLLVTDGGVMRSPAYARASDALGVQAAVFAETPPNPTEEAVERALAVYRASSCDGVVALGGGSPIDLAKAVALLATHPGPLMQYAAILGGISRITSAVAPVVAVPTTAGTGSEVGRGALITLRDHRKLGLISPHLIPKHAVCDPTLTLTLPPRLTAATGMDALAHCIETFLSPRLNPVADAIALDGAGRAFRHIEKATRNGQDLETRLEMMTAALMGGLCFQKGLGAVHSLSHSLGGLEEPTLHHGTLNASTRSFLPRSECLLGVTSRARSPR